ncbi:mannose-1-phosphate guanylyltransferase/mannose-6-phosphate isomerase [Jiella sp. M17.18]|uniref:mannose-1-phosphate guanylyltransferase/mannose-6-phosphate isomerase n=1 Tax=Jiella sp. M17.18 TaxID=3234247 RepID=UPI0034DDE95E
MPITPIIMAGGAGVRLWPVSRETMPKQFATLLGGLSTFQATLMRVSGPSFSKPIVVTNNEFRFTCGEQIAALGLEAEIVLEPVRRDSGPAVAVGALLAERQEGEKAICLVLAADHVIPETDLFVADCERAAKLAAAGHIMTLGIKPTEPSSAYGYVQPGAERLGPSALALERFVEKPDRETAERYIEQGYLWNSGNFCFAASRMISEMEAFAPAILEAARQAVEESRHDLDFIRLGETAFAAAPALSVDYAVMEKTRHGGVIAAGFSWSDVGSWDALHAIKSADADGNVLEGPVKVLGTTGSYVASDEILTAVVGLERVVVVTTRDAVLVAHMDQAAKVKTLVTELKRDGFAEASAHSRIHRPWGWYQRIDIGPRFQVKHIMVKPGAKLSLQRHYHRAEHWVVVQGTAEVTIDATVKVYHENEAAYLPIGCVHRLHNPGKIDLKLIEVQVGSYTGEDDIVRLEDDYARS